VTGWAILRRLCPYTRVVCGVGLVSPPRSYLSSMGIPVAYHLPYVGQYLYDNPRNGISIVTPTPLEHSLIQVVGISEVGAYLEAASTVIPFASPAQGVFIRTPSSPLIISHSGHPYGGNCWAALNRVTKAGFHRC